MKRSLCNSRHDRNKATLLRSGHALLLGVALIAGGCDDRRGTTQPSDRPANDSSDAPPAGTDSEPSVPAASVAAQDPVPDSVSAAADVSPPEADEPVARPDEAKKVTHIESRGLSVEHFRPPFSIVDLVFLKPDTAVDVSIDFDEQGMPERVTVLTSSGSTGIDESVLLNCYRTRAYGPGLSDRERRTGVPMRFRIDGGTRHVDSGTLSP